MLAMRSRSQTRQDRNLFAPTTVRSGDSSNPPSSSSSPFVHMPLLATSTKQRPIRLAAPSRPHFPPAEQPDPAAPSIQADAVQHQWPGSMLSDPGQQLRPNRDGLKPISPPTSSHPPPPSPWPFALPPEPTHPSPPPLMNPLPSASPSASTHHQLHPATSPRSQQPARARQPTIITWASRPQQPLSPPSTCSDLDLGSSSTIPQQRASIHGSKKNEKKMKIMADKA